MRRSLLLVVMLLLAGGLKPVSSQSLAAAQVILERAVGEFERGRITESVAAFDELVKAAPQVMPQLWQRGIALYYAGRYADCRRQFEAHRTVNPNDVENAVWHFLCVAREESPERARAALLPVGPDARVPMRQVYELFRGAIIPEQVLAAAGTQPSAEFFAHLYTGLYYEAFGDAPNARSALTAAAADRYRDAGGYMHMVATVHVARLGRAQAQPGGPGPRMGHSLVYDAAAGRVLLVDGYSWIRAVSPVAPPDHTEIWGWSGGEWRAVPGGPRDAPASRAMGRAVYDQDRRAVVSYGGRVGRAETPSNETWEWSASGWSRRANVDAGPNVHVEMAYDAARHRTIRFGGARREGPGALSWPVDTWAWEKDAWIRIATEGPVGRAASNMVFDNKRGEIVLFGGQGAAAANGEQPLFGDTWIWNGTAWRRAATSGPRPRAFHAMSFDDQAGLVLLHGGNTRDDVLDDLWAWDGTRWSEIAQVGPTPGRRRLHAMVFDERRNRTVLYGGAGPDSTGNTVGFGDTWERDGKSWTRAATRP